MENCTVHIACGNAFLNNIASSMILGCFMLISWWDMGLDIVKSRKAFLKSGRAFPVVPHKAVAEVSRSTFGEVSYCDPWMGERIHWWTERWLEFCFLEWLQWFQWSHHPELLDVVWCSAVVLVIVVWCSGVVVAVAVVVVVQVMVWNVAWYSVVLCAAV